MRYYTLVVLDILYELQTPGTLTSSLNLQPFYLVFNYCTTRPPNVHVMQIC